MLKNEAVWLTQALGELDARCLSPLLNVGSASAEFREVSQPWIDRLLFAPLRARGVEVRHLDRYPEPGIDITGDLNDPTFLPSLAGQGFTSVLCCNVLEHVPDPRALAASLEVLVPVGGYIVVSVPYRFPYHPDPIDTMFRPTVEQVVGLFPGSTYITGALVDGGTGWQYIEGNIVAAARKSLRRLRDPGGHDRVRGTGSFLPWLFRSWQLTCVVLRRE
jgi:hypothetical protein